MHIKTKSELTKALKSTNFNLVDTEIQFYGERLQCIVVRDNEDSRFATQPIILENLERIDALAKLAWIKTPHTSATDYTGERFSLKQDVIVPELKKHKKIVEGKEVLELGYGAGVFYHSVIANSECKRYVPTDILAVPDLPNFVECEATKLPFADSSFDCVVASMTLLNVIDIDQALSEIARVLRPEGEILIVDINSDTYVSSGFKRDGKLVNVIDNNNVFFTIKNLGRSGIYIHAHHPYNYYRCYFENSGFSVIDDYPFGPTKEMFSKTSSDYEKLMKSFKYDIDFPTFHLLRVRKNGESTTLSWENGHI